MTNTNPDGGTEIDIYYSDGRLQSRTGTAVINWVQYVYGVEPDDNGNERAYTLTVKLNGSGGTNTNEWSKTYTDGVGNPFQTVYAVNGQRVTLEK